MGLTFRNRTKGKGSWINYSASKNGPRASFSTKVAKNVTANISSRGVKGTVNLGNGFRYTFGGKGKRDDNSKISEFFDVSNNYSDYEESKLHWVWVLIISIVFVLLVVGGMTYFVINR
jgi:hypothetical protein